ncbi:hypothetical protein NQ166_11250 [Microbacterium sp. zg.Y1090]|nr:MULTISPECIES: hypothetical protein [unclassified Microbacterium]MCR2813084.1 hypothetical protein [Microbacterium sp. zg.Y1084]MCR2819398.1 hypothetical protein [Microbacterium sp. zg.Y1090]MDL5487058.1 hypothetical protein [Microbacterium sp. zg-Y1211]WIM28377.1 hypothetical protein QNO26_00320 [Microbacterium sp. zg-Y1090]
MSDDDYGSFGQGRQRRMKIVAWIVIGALILVGGGSTVIALLFG